MRKKNHSRFQKIFYLSAVALWLWSANSCAQLEELPDDQPEKKERPVMLFQDTTILDLYDGDVLSWIVKTAYLERWGGSERIFAKPVFVDIFDSVGEKTATLYADSGSLDTRLSFINAYGNVHAVTPKGASIRADSLTWNKRDDLVRTESPVRVVSPDGDVLTGIGFVSDTRLENWQIISNVSGIFQNVQNRVSEEELGPSKVAPPPGAKAPPQGYKAKPSKAPQAQPPVRSKPKPPKIFGQNGARPRKGGVK
jgi:LPS export ABC transporter protein LptC